MAQRILASYVMVLDGGDKYGVFAVWLPFDRA